MAVAEDTTHRARSGLLFGVWLWLSLATALFHALVPDGLPQTKHKGSAFSASTTIVALIPARIAAPATGKRAAILGNDDMRPFDGPLSAGPFVLPAAIAVLPAVDHAIAVATSWPPLLFPSEGTGGLAFRARAPPSL